MLAVNAQGKGAITATVVGPDWYPSAAFVPFDNVAAPSTIQIASAGTLPEDGFTGYSGGLAAATARWGDYSSAVVASDGSVWMAAEYIGNLPRTQLANWDTFVMSLTPDCTYQLSLGGQAFSAAGGTGSVTITTAPGCPWSVGRPPNGITLTSPASGNGSGAVTFVVPANSVGDLTNTFVIAGQSFTIEQEAASIPGLSLIGSMPHIAAEENWTTTFTMVNNTAGLQPGAVQLVREQHRCHR